MNLHSKLAVSLILILLMISLLRAFFGRRLSSGQTLFWLFFLIGAEILTLFPLLVAWLSVLWGDLVPVSWITFGAFASLIFYLLYLTVRLNRLSKFDDLARNVAYLERRVRDLERPAGKEGEAPAEPKDEKPAES